LRVGVAKESLKFTTFMSSAARVPRVLGGICSELVGVFFFISRRGGYDRSSVRWLCLLRLAVGSSPTWVHLRELGILGTVSWLADQLGTWDDPFRS
jgi:hypothetical protein